MTAASNQLELPRVVESVDEVRRAVAAARAGAHSIGCVPTMGALHAGHASLLQAARDQCGFVVATIFVNPTQFGPAEDFDRYPRPQQADLEVCRAAGVDLVLHPAVETIYPAGYCTLVEVEGLARRFEGASRPEHFRGVATVVLKLLNIVQPDRAYFGQKDFQQQLLIRTMVRDLNVPVQIRVCPTVREADGLAVSSRNAYLSLAERRAAVALWQSLELARTRVEAGAEDLAAVRSAMHEELKKFPEVSPDYATIADPQTLDELASPQAEMVALVAARVGETRLIDNQLLHAN